MCKQDDSRMLAAEIVGQRNTYKDLPVVERARGRLPAVPQLHNQDNNTPEPKALRPPPAPQHCLITRT